jgi:hypothetical protein
VQPKIAVKIKVLSGFTGHAVLYRCIPPISDYDGGVHQHIVVSAVVVPYAGAETYIFPSDSNGNVVSYSELNGSYRGGLDHKQALENAGYELKEA